MTRVLVAKLLRDVRWALLAVALLLAGFQFLWAKVTERILGKFAPLLNALGALGGLSAEELEKAPSHFLDQAGGRRLPTSAKHRYPGLIQPPGHQALSLRFCGRD